MATRIVELLYTALLGGLALYAGHALVLVLLYFAHYRDETLAVPSFREQDLPFVTVQVPMRNEQHVACRAVRAVASLDWPADRLEIQVLDDSDDETTVLVEAECARWRNRGVAIQVIHREHSSGYKAGALAAGLGQARGEYLAIFDADFCPSPDFLHRTVPYLLDRPTLGMVQARWSHLNAEYSLVTRVQAMALDAHFSVDHLARGRSGLLMNFNGAAGVWRRGAIEAAGGWQADTLTEDLDLSYRAQLAGWSVLYLPEVVVPAELPPLVSSVKAQQVRWAIGASQCLRKLAGPILRSHHLNWAQKVMALLHLSGYANQPLLLMMILLTLPMVLTGPTFSSFTIWLGGMAVIPPLLYVVGQARFYRDWPRRILVYPALMFLWIGFVWSLTLAFFQGLLTWGGAFVRTPKFEIKGRTGEWQTSTYRSRVSMTWIGEFLIGAYVCVAIWFAVKLHHIHLVPLVLSYELGQIMILTITALQVLPLRRRPR